ncbi:hypothetical protein J6590_090941 [Homalodisca vitripennis]|nr:hypothetical protein J6590_090941 [Homalodisca vitripennis]
MGEGNVKIRHWTLLLFNISAQVDRVGYTHGIRKQVSPPLRNNSASLPRTAASYTSREDSTPYITFSPALF